MEKKAVQYYIQNAAKCRKKIIILAILQSVLSKIKIFCTFSQKNFDMSEKSSIFAL